MSLEGRLHDALHAVDDYEPSPDLFTRVSRSLLEDRRHRMRVSRNVAIAIVASVLIVGFVSSHVTSGIGGARLVERWVLEVVETVLLLGLTIAMGPSIRRFGRNYVEDIFGVGGGPGTHVMRLMDLAFYLIFVGRTLQTASLSGLGSEESLAFGLQEAASRVAGFTLSMGILHALSLAALPLSGLVLASLVWRAARRGSHAQPLSSRALEADRAATWALIALIVIGLVVVTFVGPNVLIDALGG